MSTSSESIFIRAINREELIQMEWEGEYSCFRRIYEDTYNRMLSGLANIFVSVAGNTHVIGQVCLQYTSQRKELADGKTRAYLFAFRIRPEYRNQGIGSKMLSHVENDLIARGYTYLTLNVAKTNNGAIRLYQRKGFKIVAPEPGRWSYIDHQGNLQHIHEPSWRFMKKISHASPNKF